MEQINLSDGEWKIMKLLWEKSPRALSEMSKLLENDTGWSRATVFVMLKRLNAKGAVGLDESGKVQVYYPTINRGDVAPLETESFINRVYDGSIGLLFSTLTQRKALSNEEINELREILDMAEKQRRE